VRRVRAALFALSAVLLVLVGALAWRAHAGLQAERALRHRAVAERAFEEMERALSEWLEREEGRPVEHYAFYLPGSGATRSSGRTCERSTSRPSCWPATMDCPSTSSTSTRREPWACSARVRISGH
jgi:hypothetical protein